MLAPGLTRRRFAVYWGVLAAAALLAAQPAHAQEGKAEQPAAPAKEGADGQKDRKKADADVEKAREEVKRLRGEMARLHQQMRETAGKLRKAHSALAEKESHGEPGLARHHGHWARFAWGPRHRRAWGHSGSTGSVSTAELERKVDRLQKEVEQLRLDLGQKK